MIMSKGTQQHKKLKILVIGDSCEDVYHYGTCERVSPEAPVLVLKQERQVTLQGMSSNVAANLQSFGNNVEHLTNKNVVRKHRFVDKRFKQHLLRVDEGEIYSTDRIDLNLLEKYKNLDAIVISDYNKGFLLPEDCEKICKKYKNLPIFVDTKKTDLSCYNNSFIKINEEESKKARVPCNNSEVIITLGPRGACWKDNIYSTERVEVFDVCGAGDVFLSALSHRYLLTKNIESAIMFANKCASYSVTKFGTYVLKQDEINDLLGREKSSERI